MKLPPLWTIVVGQAALWCILGTTVHSWKILLYPVVWLLVGGAFYWHYKTFPIDTPPTLSSGPFSNSKSNDAAPEKVVT